MTELDAFEARFADAYRRYLDEGPTDVDAAEVARAVVAGRSRRWRVGRWTLGAVPAVAWMALLAALLLAAVVGAAVAGQPWRRDAVSGLPAGLVGTWSSLGVDPGSSSLTLTADECSVGRTCGTLTIINPDRCDYEFVLRSAATDVAVFEVGKGETFGCAYSGWPMSLRRVSLGDGDYIQVDEVNEDFGVVPYRRMFLYRLDLSRPRLPEPYAGTWIPATTGAGTPWLRLGRCAVGQPCGILDVVLSQEEVCSYLLVARSWTADGAVLDVGGVTQPGCQDAEWTGTALRLSLLPGERRLSVSRDASGEPQPVTILHPAD